MDAGYINENGYVFVTARDDDVINVAGHRISTASLGKRPLVSPRGNTILTTKKFIIKK